MMKSSVEQNAILYKVSIPWKCTLQGTISMTYSASREVDVGSATLRGASRKSGAANNVNTASPHIVRAPGVGDAAR